MNFSYVFSLITNHLGIFPRINYIFLFLSKAYSVISPSVRKRKSNKLLTPVEYNFDEITPEEPITIQSTPVELNTLQGLKETVTRVAVTYQLSPMNEEISINYMNQGEIWDRRNTLVSNVFSFQVAKGIMQNNDDQEPQTINECRNQQDWEKGKVAIQA